MPCSIKKQGHFRGNFMPQPIKSDENILVIEKNVSCSYSMPGMESAIDHYTMSYNISGGRQTVTPTFSFSYGAGDVSVMEPHIYHRTLPNGNQPCHSIMVKYTKNFAKPLIQQIGMLNFNLLNRQFVCHFSPESQAKMQLMFYELLAEYNRKGPYNEFILQGMFNRIFITLLTERIPDASSLQMCENNIHISDAMQYIEDHFIENPSLEEIAAHLFLSPTYFSKLFKKVTGSSYTTYLNLTRLQKVQLMLVTTEHSIQQIASESGFVNSNYMCDTFRKYYHIAPSEFRKAVMQNRYYQETTCNKMSI